MDTTKSISHVVNFKDFTKEYDSRGEAIGYALWAVISANDDLGITTEEGTHMV